MEDDAKLTLAVHAAQMASTDGVQNAFVNVPGLHTVQLMHDDRPGPLA